METSKTKLGADHPNTLTSMANLASTYWHQGRWGEAEKLFVEVMETSKTNDTELRLILCRLQPAIRKAVTRTCKIFRRQCDMTSLCGMDSCVKNHLDSFISTTLVDLVEGAVFGSKSGMLRSGNIFWTLSARYCDQSPSTSRNVVAAQRCLANCFSSSESGGKWSSGRRAILAFQAKSKKRGKEKRGAEPGLGRRTR